MLSIGSKAPQFALPDSEGNTVSSKDFPGKKLIVYFYPKDDTPGCTAEACSLRDNYDLITGKNAVIVGISADSEKSHIRFKTKFELPFYLLSDPDKKVIQAFGAWGEKKMMGKTYDGILRSTFIIDEKGIITHVFDKVNTKLHGEEVLKLL
ncbi:MAG: thioredoxin-dependent thiol peroxidase [Spirochaetales bacterium]|nr:thioredoxin-dependent thiol peroxidase [Spirochaetales bacterium]